MNAIHVFVGGDDGVHVDADGHVHLLPDLAFGVVDRLVNGHDVGVRADLRVHGGNAAARAVVVQHQVVDAQDALAGKEQLADLTDLFRVRLAAQQAVHGIAADLKARLEHHGRHHQADPAVDGPLEGEIGQHA